MRTDEPSAAHQQIGHLAGVLGLQARSRRNALQASRLLRVRRSEQRDADAAVRATRAPEMIPPVDARETDPRRTQPRGR